MEKGLNLVSNYSRTNPQIPFMVDNYGDIRWLLDYTTQPELKNMTYGGRSEPFPTPSTPLHPLRTSCSPKTFTFKPDARPTTLARSATSAGDFAAAGSLIRSRA